MFSFFHSIKNTSKSTNYLSTQKLKPKTNLTIKVDNKSLIVAASFFGKNKEEFSVYNVNRQAKFEVHAGSLFIYNWSNHYKSNDPNKITYNYRDPIILEKLLNKGVCFGGVDLWNIKTDKKLYEILNRYKDFYDMILPYDIIDIYAYAIPKFGCLPQELVDICLSDRCPNNLPKSIIERCKSQRERREQPAPPFAEKLEECKMWFSQA